MASPKNAAPKPLQGRTDKYLADCGSPAVKAYEMITSGQVQINGKTVYELGVRVEVGIDRVVVDGLTVKPAPQKICNVIFNKPDNASTTMEDPVGRLP